MTLSRKTVELLILIVPRRSPPVTDHRNYCAIHSTFKHSVGGLCAKELKLWLEPKWTINWSILSNELLMVRLDPKHVPDMKCRYEWIVETKSASLSHITHLRKRISDYTVVVKCGRRYIVSILGPAQQFLSFYSVMVRVEKMRRWINWKLMGCHIFPSAFRYNRRMDIESG